MELFVEIASMQASPVLGAIQRNYTQFHTLRESFGGPWSQTPLERAIDGALHGPYNPRSFEGEIGGLAQ